MYLAQQADPRDGTDQTAPAPYDTVILVMAVMSGLVLIFSVITCLCCYRRGQGRNRFRSYEDSRRDTVPLEDLLSKPSLADPESVFSEFSIEGHLSVRTSSFVGMSGDGNSGVQDSTSISLQSSDDKHTGSPTMSTDFIKIEEGSGSHPITRKWISQSQKNIKTPKMLKTQESESQLQKQRGVKHQLSPILKTSMGLAERDISRSSEKVAQKAVAFEDAHKSCEEPAKADSCGEVSDKTDKSVESVGLKVQHDSKNHENVHISASTKCSFTHEAGNVVQGNIAQGPNLMREGDGQDSEGKTLVKECTDLGNVKSANISYRMTTNQTAASCSSVVTVSSQGASGHVNNKSDSVIHNKSDAQQSNDKNNKKQTSSQLAVTAPNTSSIAKDDSPPGVNTTVKSTLPQVTNTSVEANITRSVAPPQRRSNEQAAFRRSLSYSQDNRTRAQRDSSRPKTFSLNLQIDFHFEDEDDLPQEGLPLVMCAHPKVNSQTQCAADINSQNNKNTSAKEIKAVTLKCGSEMSSEEEPSRKQQLLEQSFADKSETACDEVPAARKRRSEPLLYEKSQTNWRDTTEIGRRFSLIETHATSDTCERKRNPVDQISDTAMERTRQENENGVLNDAQSAKDGILVTDSSTREDVATSEKETRPAGSSKGAMSKVIGSKTPSFDQVTNSENRVRDKSCPGARVTKVELSHKEKLSTESDIKGNHNVQSVPGKENNGAAVLPVLKEGDKGVVVATGTVPTKSKETDSQKSSAKKEGEHATLPCPQTRLDMNKSTDNETNMANVTSDVEVIGQCSLATVGETNKKDSVSIAASSRKQNVSNSTQVTKPRQTRNVACTGENVDHPKTDTSMPSKSNEIPISSVSVTYTKHSENAPTAHADVKQGKDTSPRDFAPNRNMLPPIPKARTTNSVPSAKVEAVQTKSDISTAAEEHKTHKDNRSIAASGGKNTENAAIPNLAAEKQEKSENVVNPTPQTKEMPSSASDISITNGMDSIVTVPDKARQGDKTLVPSAKPKIAMARVNITEAIGTAEPEPAQNMHSITVISSKDLDVHEISHEERTEKRDFDREDPIETTEKSEKEKGQEGVSHKTDKTHVENPEKAIADKANIIKEAPRTDNAAVTESRSSSSQVDPESAYKCKQPGAFGIGELPRDADRRREDAEGCEKADGTKGKFSRIPQRTAEMVSGMNFGPRRDGAPTDNEDKKLPLGRNVSGFQSNIPRTFRTEITEQRHRGFLKDAKPRTGIPSTFGKSDATDRSVAEIQRTGNKTGRVSDIMEEESDENEEEGAQVEDESDESGEASDSSEKSDEGKGREIPAIKVEDGSKDDDEAGNRESADVSDESDYDNPWDTLDDAVKRASIRYNRRPSRIAAGDKELLLKSAEDLGRLMEEAEKRRQLRQNVAKSSCQVVGAGSDVESMTIPFTRFSPHRHTVKGIVSTKSKIKPSKSTEDLLKVHKPTSPKVGQLRSEGEVEGKISIDPRRPKSLTSRMKAKISSPEMKKRKQ